MVYIHIAGSTLLAAGLPSWAWALIVIAAIVVVTGAVAGFVLFRRRKPSKEIMSAPKRDPANRPPKPVRVKKETASPVSQPVKAEPAPAPVKAEPAPVKPAPAPVKEEPAPVKAEPAQPAPAPAAQDVPEGAVVVPARTFANFRYLRSFTAKLIQSDDETKARYSALKNELLAYGAKGQIGWRGESFRLGRNTAVRIVFRGKVLSLLFALDPARYADTKYKVEDVSDAPLTEKTPCLYRIKNERRVGYAKDLIAEVYAGRERKEGVGEDFAKKYPYERTEALIRKKLIRVVSSSGEPEIMQEVKATEVSTLLDDAYAKEHIEESVRYSDRTRRAIVNVDDLSRTFADGDRVTVEDIRSRVPGVDRRATYFKVLARGTLDKALTVEADDFSVDAVKMILLTGGKVIRNKDRKA